MDYDSRPRPALAAPGDAELDQLRALLADLGRAAGAFRFDVAPNPSVGAAVLSNGVEVGRGFHRVWGGAHAEVQAFEAARSSGVSSDCWDTLVVTLEPCCTQGKTPPCCEAILTAGIRRVVVGALDPDPRHRGRGLDELRAAGVEVIVLPGAAPLESVTPHFLDWTRPERLRRTRPWVIAKWAQTRTGQLTPPEGIGEGRWITSATALADVQVLRGRVDAIVTGVGTVLADDPRLTVRVPGDSTRCPLRIVLDSDLRTPPTARLFQPAPGEGAGAVHVIGRAGFDPVRYRALVAAGATVHALHPGDHGHTSLREALSLLWKMDVRRVLLEAGPTLLEAAFQGEIVDQVKVYTGPVNGGRGATLGAWLAPERLSGVERSELGEDARLDAFLRRR
jgi:diaminohydroxyphosphoribosylaminopyrimidine deaminase/5-amino-6-(5-phosphoribosylamino)uracil reductase